MTEATRVDLVVNGSPRSVDSPPHWRLLELLREGLGLTGTKEGCDDGTCGTCVVMVDGKAARACRTPASKATGKSVLTIEGLGNAESPHALQQAFAEADAVQCGFCTPGMIMAAHALRLRVPAPTERDVVEGLAGNVCRCTGYQRIVEAVRAAAKERTSREPG
jgi:aerobic-type carbon monoxide dehydrogenase small subunit (CoxS/CutS family)